MGIEIADTFVTMYRFEYRRYFLRLVLSILSPILSLSSSLNMKSVTQSGLHFVKIKLEKLKLETRETISHFSIQFVVVPWFNFFAVISCHSHDVFFGTQYSLHCSRPN